MSQVPSPPPEPDDLQFYSVEPAQPTQPGGRKLVVKGPTCVLCSQSITQHYFAVGDKIVCPMCRDRVAGDMSGGSKMGRLTKALALGLVAGFAGALIWFVVRRVTKMEIGLIAVAVGFMVGAAVRAGSGGRGGRGYQILAVTLTWFAIGANYMPDIISEFVKDFREKNPTAMASSRTMPATTQSAAGTGTDDSSASASAPAPAKPFGPGRLILGLIVLVVLAALMSLVAPILGNLTSPIGWFIVAIALWEAWKINSRRQPKITGPFAVGGANAGSGVPA